jgi:hypothetical protein
VESGLLSFSSPSSEIFSYPKLLLPKSKLLRNKILLEKNQHTILQTAIVLVNLYEYVLSGFSEDIYVFLGSI